MVTRFRTKSEPCRSNRLRYFLQVPNLHTWPFKNSSSSAGPVSTQGGTLPVFDRANICPDPCKQDLNSFVYFHFEVPPGFRRAVQLKRVAVISGNQVSNYVRSVQYNTLWLCGSGFNALCSLIIQFMFSNELFFLLFLSLRPKSITSPSRRNHL